MRILLTLLLTMTVAGAADEPGFKQLFNGKDLTGWRVRDPNANNAWKVIEGVLKNDLKAGEKSVDLITNDKFWNFTVRDE